MTVERGRIVRIDPADHGPTTGGYICGKVRHFDRRVYSPERIMNPLLRTGPRGKAAFEQVVRAKVPLEDFGYRQEDYDRIRAVQ